MWAWDTAAHSSASDLDVLHMCISMIRVCCIELIRYLQTLDWPLVFVDNVLLEHRLPVHLSVVCACFHAVTAELRTYD